MKRKGAVRVTPMPKKMFYRHKAETGVLPRLNHVLQRWNSKVRQVTTARAETEALTSMDTEMVIVVLCAFFPPASSSSNNLNISSLEMVTVHSLQRRLCVDAQMQRTVGKKKKNNVMKGNAQPDTHIY